MRLFAIIVYVVVYLLSGISLSHACGWTRNCISRHVGNCRARGMVMASIYCVHGGPLAYGGRMNCAAHTAASHHYRGTITVSANGRSVAVLINDTGPNGAARALGAELDLSSGAAAALGMHATQCVSVQ